MPHAKDGLQRIGRSSNGQACNGEKAGDSGGADGRCFCGVAPSCLSILSNLCVRFILLGLGDGVGLRDRDGDFLDSCLCALCALCG